ncbi:MAG: HAD-IA family hydrolase [Dehalococcoidia bacterium]
MPIRGLIFDFGGVINNMRWDVSSQLEDEHGLETGTIARTLYQNDHWSALQEGRGDMEVWRAAAHRALEQVAGKSMPPLHDRWQASWTPIKENIALIQALRPPYRIAVLSNAASNLEERIQNGMGIHHLFDEIVCSAVVGIAKPDHRVYHIAAERLGLPAGECVFIDDSRRNVAAAQEAGMAAIHFRVHEGDDLAQQLAELGVQPRAAKAKTAR